MSLAEDTFYFYSFDTDANVSRALGVNVSGGNASLFRRQNHPNISITNYSNATCTNDTSYFMEFNTSNVTTVTAGCMRGPTTAPINATNYQTVENWQFEAGLYGNALRLKNNNTAGGKICYEARGPLYRGAPANDNYYSVLFRIWNSSSANDVAVFDFKAWQFKEVSNEYYIYVVSNQSSNSGYNKAFLLGLGSSRLADGDYHHLEVLSTNQTGHRELAVFLDDDLKVYAQYENIGFGAPTAGQGFCVGHPSIDMAVDQILIRNITQGHLNYNRSNYDETLNKTPYSQTGGILFLDPIQLPNNTALKINATFLYPNNSNSTRIYVTGFFGDNGSVPDRFVRNATVSFNLDTCGVTSGTNQSFMDDGHPYFVSHNVTYSCGVSNAAFNTTAVDAIGTAGMDVGIEETPRNLATLTAARHVRNLVRGYGSYTLVLYQGDAGEDNLAGAARYGYMTLSTPAGPKWQTTFQRPFLRNANCLVTDPLNCMTNVTFQARAARTWGIASHHWQDPISTYTFERWINYTTNTTDVRMMSVRDAQQLWFPELNSSGITMPANRTANNYTPVLLFFGDGYDTPVLQSLNLSYSTASDTTAPTLTTTNVTTNDSIGLNLTTSELANASVLWGLSASSMPNRTNYSTAWTNTSFFFNLTNLTPNTNYYYNVTTCDSSGNCNVSLLNTTPTANNLPVISAVTIAPNPLTRNDSANCSWTYTDADGDAQGAHLIYWYVNASLVTSQNYTGANVSLASTFYARGDTTYCSVRGNDTEELSTGFVNGSRLVDNSPPYLTSLTLTPASPTKASTLTCAAIGTDADADNLTAVYTFIDSDNTTRLQENSTNATFECGNSASCTRGDNITCRAQLYDGTESGTENSSLVNTTIQILNTAPTTPLPTILPPQPNATTSNLTCNYTYADLDSDSRNATYLAWYRNGTNTSNHSQGLNANLTLNGSGYFNASDTWQCELIVQDAVGGNSTVVNSTPVTIGSSAPSVTIFDDGGLTDVDSNLSLNWTWALGSGSGPFTHTVCNSSSFVAAGCGDTLLCRLEDNTSPSVCNWTANATFRTNTTAYLLLQDGSSTNSSLASNVFTINHRPNSSNVSLHVNTSNNINTYNCTLTGSNDSDSDALTLYYAFSTADGTALQAESATSTYSAAAGNATHGDAVTCRARASDGRLYGPHLNTSNHSRINPPSISAGSFGENTTFTVIVTNVSGAEAVNLTLTDPINQLIQNLPLTYVSGTTWRYSFQPSTLGTWTVTRLTLTQTDTFGYTYLGSGDTFTVSTASTASTGGTGGGGGSTPPLPQIQAIPPSPLLQATAACGNRVCEAGESALGACRQDCPVDLDTLFACLWTNKKPCNWEEDWFAALITYVVLGIGLFALTAHLMAQSGRPLRWFKNTPRNL